MTKDKEKRKAADRRYRQRHRKQILEYNRKYRAKNRDKIREYYRRYVKEHIYEVREYARKHGRKKWDEDREGVLRKNREYKRSHRDKVREWNRRYYEKRMASETESDKKIRKMKNMEWYYINRDEILKRRKKKRIANSALEKRRRKERYKRDDEKMRSDADFYALQRAKGRKSKAINNIKKGMLYRPRPSRRIPDWCMKGQEQIDSRSGFLLDNINIERMDFAKHMAIGE